MIRSRVPFLIAVLATVPSTIACLSSGRAARNNFGEWVYPQRLQTALSRTEGDRRLLLEQLLRDYDPNVRIVAAESLADIRSESSIEPLVTSLQDSDIFVRSTAQQALARIGIPAVRRLLQGVRSGMANPPAHVQALALFGMLGHWNKVELPAELLEQALSETKPVRCFGLLCLKKAIPPMYPPLARQAHITGRVRLEFTVSASGYTEQLKALGHPLLISSAVDAIQKSTFETSSPSNDRYAVTIDYELSGNPSEPGRPAFDVVPPNYWRIVVRPPLLNVDAGRPDTGAFRSPVGVMNQLHKEGGRTNEGP